MKSSAHRGKSLCFEILEPRTTLSASSPLSTAASGLTTNVAPSPAQVQPGEIASVAAGVNATQVVGLVKDLAQNVRTLLRTVGDAANDPGIVSSLKSDLASLTGGIGQIINKLGNASTEASLAIQARVTSATNPEAAAILQSVVTNSANDLQSINMAVGNLGASISGSLSNQISSSLSQLGNVISSVSVAVSGAIGAANLATTVGGSLSGLGSLVTDVRGQTFSLNNIVSAAVSDVPTVSDLPSSIIGSAIQNMNSDLQEPEMLPLEPLLIQPLTVSTASTVGGGSTSVSTDLLSTLLDDLNTTVQAIQSTIFNQAVDIALMSLFTGSK